MIKWPTFQNCSIRFLKRRPKVWQFSVGFSKLEANGPWAVLSFWNWTFCARWWFMLARLHLRCEPGSKFWLQFVFVICLIGRNLSQLNKLVYFFWNWSKRLRYLRSRGSIGWSEHFPQLTQFIGRRKIFKYLCVLRFHRNSTAALWLWSVGLMWENLLYWTPFWVRR